MRRRDFIALVAGAATPLPRRLQAQEVQKLRRVSMLLALTEKDPEATQRVKGFRLGMRKPSDSERIGNQ